MRSSITGAGLLDPTGRVLTFKRAAGAAVQYLQTQFPEQLGNVNIGFATMPIHRPTGEERSQRPMYYDIDREKQSIILYRLPIQRFRGLHVDDEEHRRMFIEHCVYEAVCEYLDVDPWNFLPGRFDHY